MSNDTRSLRLNGGIEWSGIWFGLLNRDAEKILLKIRRRMKRGVEVTVLNRWVVEVEGGLTTNFSHQAR